MMTTSGNDYEALQKIISALSEFDEQDQRRILLSSMMFLNIQPLLTGAAIQGTQTLKSATQDRIVPAFSEDTALSPKEFLLEKRPQTEVERIACLAYYLTHYREAPHFKTLDISKLNTEAAQPKMSNAAQGVSNAVKTGYLASATKGFRQLSAAGESFVAALPDRPAAREAMAAARPKRAQRKKKSRNNRKAK